MIDLSASWNVKEPVFKQLPDGPVANSSISTLSSDGTEWFLMFNGTGHIYNVQRAIWSPFPTSNTKISHAFGLSASTDPHTNVAYIPNGAKDVNGRNQLLRINLTTKKLDNVVMHPKLNTSNLFSTSWSHTLNSLVVIGGPTNGLFTYSSSTGWSDLTLAVKGDIPAPRVTPCLASGYGVMILFGGTDVPRKKTFNDIYILDAATLTWTRGPNVELENARAASNCAISNRYFIVWGGIRTNNINNRTDTSFPRNSIMVYDIAIGNWTSVYVASTTTDANADSEATGEGSTVKIILIVVLAFLVIFIGIGVFVLCRRPSRLKKLMGDSNCEEENSSHTIAPVILMPSHDQSIPPAYDSNKELAGSTASRGLRTPDSAVSEDAKNNQKGLVHNTHPSPIPSYRLPDVNYGCLEFPKTTYAGSSATNVDAVMQK
ncbi:hypothetical protein BGZ65_012855 [Modicella reniformis]|uniref:Uncharacterized protein n=1 Tax=Modicella reniformis TaxID=1440133 RepID=A0A9P6IM76_9FUNG|nr:hypothetical protein BGZ65_012855 [Modicella reniformis]